MTIKVRFCSLSADADALLRAEAERERMEPDQLASLLLEITVRERAEAERRFRVAADKVLNGA
jgi:hypothetical protein